MRTTIAGIGTLLGASAFVLSAGGCTLQASGDASRFRQPIPQTSQVALAIAGSHVAGTTATQAAPQ